MKTFLWIFAIIVGLVGLAMLFFASLTRREIDPGDTYEEDDDDDDDDEFKPRDAFVKVVGTPAKETSAPND